MLIVSARRTIILEEVAEFESLGMTGSNDQWLRDNAHSLLDAVVDAVIAMDNHGTIQFVNSAALSMFGFAAEELIQQPVSLLMPEPSRTEHQLYVERYVAEGAPRVLGSDREILAQTKTGRQFPVSLKVSEVVVGKQSWFIGIVRDLSENAALQKLLVAQRERFAQINRMATLGEMTANIAHEINQPLAAISIYAQASRRLLDRDVVDESKLVAALEKLSAQSIRAGKVVEHIQNIVRSDSGKKTQASINQILEEVHPLVIADVKASGIELTLNLPHTSPTIVCEVLQIQQVLINLVRNAVDAMLEVDCRYGRSISINCDDSTLGLIAVSVVDRGPGVDQRLQNVIFDAFQTTKPLGTGMGLSVSRSMIEQHQGTLSFQNNPDWGATFTFRLPSLIQPGTD